jgi:YggT family protein
MTLLHFIPTIIDLFFKVLIVFLLVRVILSFFPLPPANPIVRFFMNVTDPIIAPVAKRIPRMGVGMFDVSLTIAFIFTWWVILMLDGLIVNALPPGW